MITHIHIEGYRSIRSLRLDFGRTNVILGPNGCGKTNLYRALYLLAEAAHGRFARALADEGGMPSALWAGARRKGPAQVFVSATLDEFTYELACGLPQVGSLMWEGHNKPSRFTLDPRIKREKATFVEGKRAAVLLERENATTWLRDADGARVMYPIALRDAESVLAQLQDPQRYPVVASLAAELRSWRFYHHFRTDLESPLRHPQVGIQTPVLAADGTDLAAALQTIREIGDGEALDEEVERAFPGARLEIDVRDEEARFAVQMAMPGIARPPSCCRTVRRHAAIPLPPRRTLEPAAAHIPCAERAGDESPPRLTRASRAPGRAQRQVIANLPHDARRAARSGDRKAIGRVADSTAKGGWGDDRVGRVGRRDQVKRAERRVSALKSLGLLGCWTVLGARARGGGATFSRAAPPTSVGGSARPMSCPSESCIIPSSADGRRFMDLDSGTARRLRAAFPSALVTDVDAMLRLVDVGEHEPSAHDIGPVVVNGEALQIPARIYSPEVAADALVGLTTVARTALECLFTRHHDGHVREKYVRAVISSRLSWVPPFVVQLLGEYVAEIHLTIRQHRDELNGEPYRRFVTENPAFIELTRQRVASYWNCYYRTAGSQLSDYPGHQVLEVLAPSRVAAEPAVAADGASPRR